MTRFASIIPLNYEFHLEHSVMLVETKWRNLITLLEQPGNYLSVTGTDWEQQGGAYVPWTLEQPAVAQFTPLTKRYDLAYMIIDALNEAASSEVEFTAIEKPELSTILTDWEEFLLEMWRTHPVLSKGIFVVEFAPETAILHVSYLPPSEDQRPNETYTGGYTTVTVSTNDPKTSGSPGSTASVHVDLTDEPNAEPTCGASPRQRACFVFDMLTDLTRFASKLNDSQAYFVEHRLVTNDESGGRVPTIQHIPKPNNRVRVDSKVTFMTPGQILDKPDLPFATVEGLGPTTYPPTCTPCVCPKTLVNGKHHVLGEIVVKCYLPVNCPPKE